MRASSDPRIRYFWRALKSDACRKAHTVTIGKEPRAHYLVTLY